MKNLPRTFLTLAAALTYGIICENSVYSQAKEPTLVEAADVDNPDLKLTLEIYPTEIYLGDVVYFAARIENVSDKTIEKCVDFRNLPPYITYPGCVKISSPQLEHEYLWIPENTTGGLYHIILPQINLQKGEKRAAGYADVELPPLEDWNDPFWKEIREKMTSDGIVCQFQVTQRYGDVSSGQNALFTQDILIKPRPKEETQLLETWFNNTPKELFPVRLGTDKLSEFSAIGRDDGGFIVINGKEYNPSRFVRTVTFRKPFIPNNPTNLEGWRKLDSMFCDSTLHDEIKYTRLLLEYLVADDKKTEQAKNELASWIETLPSIQRRFFLGSLMHECRWFRNGTPFEEKSRVLMDYYNVSYDVPESPEAPYPRHKYAESMAPTQEEIANGSKTLQDGCRMWVFNGPVFTELLAAKIVKFNGNGIVTLQYRDLSKEDLNVDQFSKEDREYLWLRRVQWKSEHSQTTEQQ